MPAVSYRFSQSGADGIAQHLETITQKALRMGAAFRLASSTVVTSQAAVARSVAQTASRVEASASKEAAAAGRAEKAHEKTEAQKTAATTREIKKREKAEDAHYAKLLRDVEKQASAVEKAEARSQARRQAQAARSSAKIAAEQSRLEEQLSAKRYDRMGSLASGIGSAALGTIGAGVGIAGGVATAAIVDRIQLRDKATRLSINARGAGENGVGGDVLAREAELVAWQVKGTKAADIIDAQSKFVAMTGDLDSARKQSATWANASMASGANVSDIAATAATMRTKFGITNDKDSQQAMSSLIFQGKQGAFEMSDAAQYYEEMGAAGSRFGLDKGVSGVKTLGGLSQIAKGSTGSGAEAATAVRAMFDDLVQHADKNKMLTGTSVFTDSGKTKTNNIEDVLVHTISGAKGNQGKLGDLFGERGMKAVSGLVTAYNDAQNALGKGASETDKRAAGEAAMRSLLNQSINAQGNWNEVLKDSAAAQGTTGNQLNAVWERLKATVGAAVLPVLKTMSTDGKSLSAAIKLLALGTAGVVEAFAAMVKKLIQWKVIDAPQEEGTKQDQFNAAAARLDELDKIQKGGNALTPEQNLEQLTLQAKKGELERGGISQRDDLEYGSDYTGEGNIGPPTLAQQKKTKDTAGKNIGKNMADKFLDDFWASAGAHNEWGTAVVGPTTTKGFNDASLGHKVEHSFDDFDKFGQGKGGDAIAATQKMIAAAVAQSEAAAATKEAAVALKDSSVKGNPTGASPVGG